MLVVVFLLIVLLYVFHKPLYRCHIAHRLPKFPTSICQKYFPMVIAVHNSTVVLLARTSSAAPLGHAPGWFILAHWLLHEFVHQSVVCQIHGCQVLMFLVLPTRDLWGSTLRGVVLFSLVLKVTGTFGSTMWWLCAFKNQAGPNKYGKSIYTGSRQVTV